MSVATAEEVRQHCNLGQVKDDMITPRLSQATRRITAQITQGTYATLSLASEPYTVDDRSALVLAEALLAGWYLLPFLTHVATAKGIHRQGGKTNGNSEVGLLDRRELEALRSEWLTQVEELLAPYVPAPDPAAEDAEPLDSLVMENMTLTALGGS